MFNNMSSIADPLILEIFLYKSNYKDRILIAEMREHAQIVSLPTDADNSFFIRVDEIDEILNTKFKKDLINFASTPYTEVGPSVTSIYFINSILDTFHNLKYIKVNVSDSNVYSRKVDNQVQFDYKIIHSKVDLTVVLSPTDLMDVKDLLIAANIYKSEPFFRRPYIEMSAKDFINILLIYSSKFEPSSETAQLITGLKNLLGQKMEVDNPILLIIVEK